MGQYRCSLKDKLKLTDHHEWHPDIASNVCPILRDLIEAAAKKEDYEQLARLMKIGDGPGAGQFFLTRTIDHNGPRLSGKNFLIFQQFCEMIQKGEAMEIHAQGYVVMSRQQYARMVVRSRPDVYSRGGGIPVLDEMSHVSDEQIDRLRYELKNKTQKIPLPLSKFINPKKHAIIHRKRRSKS